MNEEKAKEIIESGKYPGPMTLRAARFIVGVMRDQQRIYARMETINHEAIKIIEKSK